MVDYAAGYANLPRCLISYASASPETQIANQTPQGLLASLFVKKMIIGLPFRYNKDSASIFVKKVWYAVWPPFSLFEKVNLRFS